MTIFLLSTLFQNPLTDGKSLHTAVQSTALLLFATTLAPDQPDVLQHQMILLVTLVPSCLPSESNLQLCRYEMRGNKRSFWVEGLLNRTASMVLTGSVGVWSEIYSQTRPCFVLWRCWVMCSPLQNSSLISSLF